MAPTGLRADDVNLVVPTLGTVVGGGTLDSGNNLNFNAVATVSSAIVNNAAGAAAGGLTQALGGGGANCKNGGIKVPFQIHGTASNPQFVPDVGGATANLLKSELTCAGGTAGGVQSIAGGLAGGKTGATADAVTQLGGLLGGKKKKP
jgi:hypothetical protein